MPAGETHEHGLDVCPVGEGQQVFARKAVAGVRLKGGWQHTEPCFGRKPSADLGGQLRHGGQGVGTFPVEVIPEPRDVDRAEFPAREKRSEFRAGEGVEIEGCGVHPADIGLARAKDSFLTTNEHQLTRIQKTAAVADLQAGFEPSRP
jgi:hypothetical protein